ncbi:hypothetical protein NEMBOFW57_009522 [Staphylotrichum longicolle]|uniref:Uncharacterized protein n=1 Tax=Staphylotrichum longicolle TaxID=669026 RepID=A0AAD4EP70_9PEZI|nr:hypothetical protein NEMBOFW57_009522 [Staphylotrichum longicolle]
MRIQRHFDDADDWVFSRCLLADFTGFREDEAEALSAQGRLCCWASVVLQPLPQSQSEGEEQGVRMWELGFVVERTLNIVIRISGELDQDILTLFPDIEILPNITGDLYFPHCSGPGSQAPAGYHEAKRPHYNPEGQTYHNNLPSHPSPRERLAAIRPEFGMPPPSLPSPYTNRDGYYDPRVTYPDARAAYPSTSGGHGGHSRSYSLDSHLASFHAYPTDAVTSTNNTAYQPGYPQGYQAHPQPGYQQEQQGGYTTTTAANGMRPIYTTAGNPAFAASELGQNGFCDAAYWDGQQRTYAQAQQQHHHRQQGGEHPYYQGGAVGGTAHATVGAPGSGTGTSRHTGHLSMPAQRGDGLRPAGQGEQGTGGGAPVPMTKPHGLWYGTRVGWPACLLVTRTLLSDAQENPVIKHLLSLVYYRLDGADHFQVATARALYVADASSVDSVWQALDFDRHFGFIFRYGSGDNGSMLAERECIKLALGAFFILAYKRNVGWKDGSRTAKPYRYIHVVD